MSGHPDSAAVPALAWVGLSLLLHIGLLIVWPSSLWPNTPPSPVSHKALSVRWQQPGSDVGVTEPAPPATVPSAPLEPAQEKSATSLEATSQPSPALAEPAVPAPLVKPAVSRQRPAALRREPKPRFVESELLDSVRAAKAAVQISHTVLAPEPARIRPARPSQVLMAEHASVAAAVAASQPEQRPSSAAPEPDLTELVSLIRRAVAAQQRYPRLARRRGREGVATVAFSMNERGVLDGVSVVAGSGDRGLDKAALAAVQAIAPFTPAREHLTAAHPFRIEVEFRLQ